MAAAPGPSRLPGGVLAPERGPRTSSLSTVLSELGDRLFRSLCAGAALLIIALAALLVVVLVWKSGLAIKTIGISFFTSSTWDPEPSHRIFGALSFVYGTVATSLIAMII